MLYFDPRKGHFLTHLKVHWLSIAIRFVLVFWVFFFKIAPVSITILSHVGKLKPSEKRDML
jgi:hypothetical protein